MANNQISKRKKKRKNMYVLTEICAFFLSEATYSWCKNK